MLDVISKIILDAQVKGAQNVDDLKTRLGNLTKQTKDMRESANALREGMNLLGQSLTIAGFEEFVRRTIDSEVETGKLAQRLGLGVEQMSVWQFAVKQADVEQESFTTGVQKLSLTIAQAEGGNRKAIDTLKNFGITTAELRDGSLSTQDVMERVAATIAKMPDGYEKTGLAAAAFGRGGAALIPVLNEIGGNFEEVRAQAEAAGATLTDDTVARAEETKRKFNLLGAELTGLARDFVNGLLPALDDTGSAFKILIESKDGTTGFITAVDEAVRALASGFITTAFGVKFVIDTLVTGAKQAKDVATFHFKAAADEGKDWYQRMTTGAQALADAIDNVYKSSKLMHGEVAQDEVESSPFVLGGGKPQTTRPQIESQQYTDELRRLNEEAEKLKESTTYVQQFGTVAKSTALATLDFNLQYGALADAGLTTKEEAALRKAASAVDDWAKAHASAIAVVQSREVLAAENDRILKLQEETASLGQNKLVLESLNEQRRLDAEYRKLSQQMSPEDRQRLRAELDLTQQLYDAQLKLNYERSRSFEVGLLTAVDKYVEHATNAADQTERMFSTLTNGLENSIIRATQTGKLSFRDLANEIIVDLEKIAIERLIAGVVSSAVGYFVAPSSSAPSSGGGGGSSSIENAGFFSRGGYVSGFADGGLISGPGSGTSDSIPAWLSDGEYVMSAASVARVGKNNLDAINQGRTVGGGANITVVNHVDARNAVSPGEIARALEATRQKTINDISELIRRGKMT